MDQITPEPSTSTQITKHVNSSKRNLRCYFDVDYYDKLRKKIQDLNEVAFKIIVHPKRSPLDKEPLYSIVFAIGQLKTSQKANETEDDELDALLDNIEFLQKSYDQLMVQVKDKIKELQVQYQKEGYQIIIIKRRPGQTIPVPAPDKSDDSNDENLTESIVISNKRKCNFENPTTSYLEKQMSTKEFPKISDKSLEILIIGPNGTEVSRENFDKISWNNHTEATMKLCELIFEDQVLAYHSLIGNPSPEFQGHAGALECMDTQKIGDIIYLVCNNFNVSQALVRSTIITKCADTAMKLKRLKTNY